MFVTLELPEPLQFFGTMVAFRMSESMAMEADAFEFRSERRTAVQTP